MKKNDVRKRVNILLSPNEKKKIQKMMKAERTKLSFSAFVREKIFTIRLLAC